MLRSRAIPLIGLRHKGWGWVRVTLDPGLVLGLTFLGWRIGDNYSSSPWGAVVAAGLGFGVGLNALTQTLVARAAGGRIRGISLTLFGGRARILAPGRSAGIEWRAALAGPAVAFFFGLTVLVASDVVAPRHADLRLALHDLGRYQVLFAMLQLIPAFPFDGGRVLRALASRRLGVLGATRLAATLGKLLAFACLTFAIVRGELPPLFVALFLYAGADGEQHDDAIASALAGQRARDAAVAPDRGVSVLDMCGEVGIVLARSAESIIPIMSVAGAPLGAVSLADLRHVGPTVSEHRWMVTLGDVLPSLGGVVAADASLYEVRRQMLRRGVSAVAVVEDDGALVGVLSMRRLDHRIELGEVVAAERALFGLEPISGSLAVLPSASNLPTPPASEN